MVRFRLIHSLKIILSSKVIIMNVSLDFRKSLGVAISLFCAATMSVHAQDFSEGSQAKEFGLVEEVPATFSGKVVDIACELTGDCPDNCGDANRNLGIIREADDKLIMVLKNAQFAFNGPAYDLVKYCNKQVDVDGLLIGDIEEKGAQFYMLQFIRDKGAADWTKANQWTAGWKARNPEAGGKGPWFRRDPRVLKQIKADGYFGLGHEVDQQYADEQ